MNKRMYHLLIFVLLFTLPVSAFAKLIIMNPQDKSIVEESALTIVGIEDTEDKDEIAITTKGTDADGDVIDYSEEARIYDKEFSLEVELYPGENEIKVGSKSFKVFYNDGTLTPPETYKKYILHKIVSSGCTECHDTDEPELPISEDKTKLCKRCHPQYKKIIVKPKKVKPAKKTIRKKSTKKKSTGKKKKKKKSKKKKEFMYKNLHKPVLEGKCLECHKPHYSENQQLLKKTPISTICADCHEEIFNALKTAEVPHPPQKKGKCVMCHSPHASEEKFLFKKSLKFICVECHETFLTDKEGIERKSIHKYTIAGACYECHDLHYSEQEKSFIEIPLYEMCLKCHKEKATGKHSKLERYCLSCHDPHSSDYENLLPVDKDTICNSCHEDAKKDTVAHKVSKKENCQSCHESLHGLPDLKETRQNCFKCHTDTDALKNVHGGFEIPVENCFSCHNPHTAVKGNLFGTELHPPFEDKECDSCHEVTDGKINLSEEGSALCYQCHDSVEMLKDEVALKNIHSPVLEGECVACHNPHASNYKKFLTESVSELCFECHDALLTAKSGEQFTTLHPPAEDGECIECHQPHGAMLDKNLKEKVATLCFNCHDDFAEDMGDNAILHPPYEDRECTTCHNPHGTDTEHLINFTDDIVCFECHDDVTKNPEDDNKFNVVHDPVAKRECSKCHDPHAAKYEPMLRLKGNELCKSCHKVVLNHHPLKYESNFDGIVIEKGFKRDGEEFACLGCHNPHASNNLKMFKKPKEAFCNKCHKDM